MITSVTIKFDTVNEAFGRCPENEIVRVLRSLAMQIDAGNEPNKVADYNGNTIGSIEYTRDNDNMDIEEDPNGGWFFG